MRVYRGPLEVTLPPDWKLLPTLRLLVAGLLSDLNLTIEEIDDLKLLISEGFALLCSVGDLIRSPLERGERKVRIRFTILEGEGPSHVPKPLTFQVSYDLTSQENTLISTEFSERRSSARESSLLETEGIRIELLKNLADRFELHLRDRDMKLLLEKQLYPRKLILET